MFWGLLLVAAGVATLYYRWQRRRIYKIHEELPAGNLLHYPVVGHAHNFLGTDEDRMLFFKTLAETAVQQGGLASIWMGSRLYVIVCDPETAEVVAKACPCKDEATYRMGRMAVGNGSIFAPGKQPVNCELDSRADSSVFKIIWLQEVFGNSDRPVTAEDLPKLNYLEIVIKETLRLYPPAPIIAREVHDDVTLPCGTTLVDGVSIVVNLLGLHRDPKFWGDDAEHFRPERFLEGSLRHHAQYLPFSYSVRSCPGNKYAMMSMKTALSNLLRRFRLLPAAGASAAELRAPLRMKFNVMMKHVDGYTVRLQQRINA